MIHNIQVYIKTYYPKIYSFSRFLFKDMLLRLRSPEAIFSHKINKNLWLGIESLSGLGSELMHTIVIRGRIPLLLKDYDIKTLLDAPCGDFNWMRKVDIDFLDKYIGVDLVNDIVISNKKNIAMAIKSLLD
jgi:hypothetical protein